MNEKWKCTHHKGSYCHFLHLNINFKVHRICFQCKFYNKIPDHEILSIHELLESDESTFFSNYPVLKEDSTLKDF